MAKCCYGSCTDAPDCFRKDAGMNKLHTVDVAEIVDLIRAIDRDRGIELMTGSLNIAHGIGFLAGSQVMGKIADNVFDRAKLENTQPTGAA
jgi:hypothetical protein